MSIKEIAKEAGTSPSTVSRVLNNPEYKCADPKLKDRIWDAAIRLTQDCRAARVRADHQLRAARQIALDVISSAWKSMDWKKMDRRAEGIAAREFRKKGAQEGRTAELPAGQFHDRLPSYAGKPLGDAYR